MANNSIVVSDEEIDQIMAGEVIANTAQGVLHKLEELERNRDHVLTRWVWELLQNARDAAVEPDTSLIASVDFNDRRDLVSTYGCQFQHRRNGPPHLPRVYKNRGF